MKKLIFGCGFVVIALSMQAQVKEGKISKRLGLEMGFHELYGTMIVPEALRVIRWVETPDGGYYDDRGGHYYGSNQFIHKAYVGIKYEALFSKNTFGIASGLRFSRTSAELDQNKRYPSFSWLSGQNEQGSIYVTMQSINQRNYYIGVPLEFRFFPRKSDRFLKTYFKFGGALNYRFSTKYKIDFQDPHMSDYAAEIENNILKPCTFSGFVFPAFGFRLGRNMDPWFNLEFQFPGFIIAQRKHSFVDPDVGFGMQFSVLMPINK